MACIRVSFALQELNKCAILQYKYIYIKVMFMFRSFVFIVLFGCTTVKSIDSSEVCSDPISEAGADITVALGQPAVLDASESSWCSTYEEDVVLNWGFVSVPSDSAVNENALSANRTNAAISPQFVPDELGEYVLSLQVNDGVSSSNIDYVVVNVIAGDAPPTADCGGSYEGEIGQIVTIDGSLSMDPEFSALEYSWSLTSPSCSDLTSSDIYNEGTPTPSFVPDCEGLYVVSIVVSDGVQWSEPAICSVDVASENRLPFADAGKTESYGGCASNPFQLNGHGSYDPDGDTLTYSWSLVSAPTDSLATTANLDDPNIPVPSFSWDVQGTYTFQLQVSDGEAWSAPDLVDITIGDLNDNHRPIANAGDSMTIEASANCQNTSYSSDCTDCTAFTLLLDGSGSMDVDGDILSFNWTESSGVLGVVTPTSAVTSAIIPTQSPGTSLSFDVTLEVSDCQRSDTDLMTITYSCTSN